MRALAGFEKSFSPVRQHTLTSAHNLGDLYEAKGDFAAAEMHYRRATTGRLKELGADHSATLKSVYALANL